MKKHDVFDIELDEEEQEISDAIDKAIERGELKSVPNVAARIAEARQIAANTLRKDARVNIRISSTDLRQMKEKAAFKGSVVAYDSLGYFRYLS